MLIYKGKQKCVLYIIVATLIFSDLRNHQKYFYAIHLKTQNASNLKLRRALPISMKTIIMLFLEK